VIAATLARLIGASVTVNITAPFPTLEKTEFPTILPAIILAYTDYPQFKLNGDALKIEIGI